MAMGTPEQREREEGLWISAADIRRVGGHPFCQRLNALLDEEGFDPFGEGVERSFAHLYETGGMRRTHLRGHTNILKRLLIHTGAFNLGLILRQIVGVGKPRQLQGSVAAVSSLILTVGALGFGRFVARHGHSGRSRPAEFQFPRFMAAQVAARKTATSATGCCAGRRNSANGTGPPGKRPADRLCGNEEPLRC